MSDDVNRFDELAPDPFNALAPEGDLEQETVPPGPDALIPAADNVPYVELKRQGIQPQSADVDLPGGAGGTSGKLELDARSRHLVMRNVLRKDGTGGNDILVTFAQPLTSAQGQAVRVRLGEVATYDDLFLTTSVMFVTLDPAGVGVGRLILEWW